MSASLDRDTYDHMSGQHGVSYFLKDDLAKAGAFLEKVIIPSINLGYIITPDDLEDVLDYAPCDLYELVYMAHVLSVKGKQDLKHAGKVLSFGYAVLPNLLKAFSLGKDNFQTTKSDYLDPTVITIS